MDCNVFHCLVDFDDKVKVIAIAEKNALKVGKLEKLESWKSHRQNHSNIPTFQLFQQICAVFFK